MVVYVKDSKGHLKTFQEIAYEYKLPVSLVYSRYLKGIRDIKELTLPKYDKWNKD